MRNSRMDLRLLFNLADSEYYKDRIRGSEYIDPRVMKDVEAAEVVCVLLLIS